MAKKEEKKKEMAGKMGKTVHEHHHYMEETPSRESDSMGMEGGKCPTCGHSYDPENEAIKSPGKKKLEPGMDGVDKGEAKKDKNDKKGGENVR